MRKHNSNKIIRPVYQSGEVKKRGNEIMGSSETHWTGQSKVVLEEGETIILYAGRENNNHREGVGILMSNFATRALIDWMPVNE